MPEPLEQPVEFDITGALASIQTLDQALAEVAANFGAALADAVAQLSSATIEVDTSQIGAQVEQAIADATTAPVPLEADTSGISTAIDTAVGEPTVPVPVEGDTAPLESSIADATTGIEPPIIPVEGDTSGLEEQIAAAAAVAPIVPIEADVGPLEDQIATATANVTATVEVDADTSAAQQAIDALAAHNVDIGVDADTADAQQQIDALGDSATGAAGGGGGHEGLAGLEGAVLGVKAATGAATGEVGGLTEVVGGLSTGLGAAVAGGAAFTAFIGTTVKLAADAQAQQARFNATFGESAEAVKNINVGGLTTDLETLGKQSGTTNADLEASATRIGLLGAASGAAQPEVAKTASDLLGLSGALAVANPRLGDTATVADTISRALSTGRTRALIPYGISLSATAIQQEALNETQKESADQLTGYDKLVAGLTLALAQQGDTLGTKYAAGVQNAQIQLRALKVEVEEALVAVGTPLLEPAVSSLQDLLPVAEQVGIALGKLAQGVFPLVSALAPALVPLADVLGLVGDGLGVVAAGIDLIPSPVILGLAGGFLALSVALASASSGLGFFGLALAAAEGPIGILLIALTGLGIAAHIFGGHSQEAAAGTASLDEAFKSAASSAGGFSGILDNLNPSIENYLKSTLEAGDAGKRGVDTANTLGVSYKQIADALSGSDAEYGRFRNNLERSSASLGISGDQSQRFFDILEEGRGQLEANASAALQLAQQQGLLDAQTFLAAQSLHTQKGFLDDNGHAIVDWIGVAKDLAPTIDAATQAANEHAAALTTLSPEYADLVRQFAAGTISLDTFTTELEKFGFVGDGAATQAKAVADSLNSVLSAVNSALPTTGSAIDDFAQQVKDDWDQIVKDTADGTGSVKDDLKKLADDQDPQRFTDNLLAQAGQIAGFAGSLSTLIAEGFGPLAAELAQKGPEAAAGLADSLANDESKAKMANSSLVLRNAAVDNLDTLIKNKFPELEGLGGQVATHFLTGITGKLNSDGSVTTSILTLSKKFVGDQPVNATNAPKVEVPKPDLDGAKAAGEQTGQAAQTGFVTTFKPSDAAATAVQKIGPAVAGASPAAAASATNLAEGATASFAGHLHFGGELTANLQSLPGRIAREAGGLNSDAAALGAGVGASFGRGLASGLGGEDSIIAEAARHAVRVLERAARLQAESQSPSKVAERIGKDWSAGLALGVADVQQVAAAGTIIVQALTDSTSTALAGAGRELGGQISGGVIEGFTDQATINAAAARLQEFVARATAGAGDAAVSQVISQAESQIPGSAAAVALFGQQVSSALGAQEQAFDRYHDALKTFHADQTELVALAPKVAFAVEVLRQAQVRLANDTAAGLSASTLAADAALVAQAQQSVDVLQGKLTDAQRQVDTDRAGIGSSTHDLEAAQHALVAASNPDAFIRNLDRQTQANRRFQADIRKLAAEGFTDLAKQLAQAGPEAAGKLADGLANNATKARAAERAVDSARAFGDSYKTFLEKQFAPSAAAVAGNAGVVIGGALSAGVQESSKGAADAALVELRSHLGTITPKVAIDTGSITVGGAAPVVRVTPRLDPLGPVTFASASLEVIPHVALPLAEDLFPPQTVHVTPEVDLDALAALAFPPATVDVEPILLPLPPLEPITVTVIPKLEPIPQVVVPATAEQLVVAGTPATASSPATAPAGPQILELDLTLNLEDGRVATATATVPIPSSAGKQILKAAVEAKVQAG